MEKLLEKLSSYHLLTVFIPGFTLCYLLRVFSSISLPPGDKIYDYIVFYFVGVVVSRFGSVVIEPIFRCFKIIEYSDYGKYIEAEKTDKKIIELSEANNFYRSMLSSLVLFTVIYIYKISSIVLPFLQAIKIPLFTIGLIILFALSYKKQTSYIKKRCDLNCQIESKQKKTH